MAQIANIQAINGGIGGGMIWLSFVVSACQSSLVQRKNLAKRCIMHGGTTTKVYVKDVEVD